MDEHAWLRDREDPRVRAFLEAENRRAEDALAAAAPLREKLYREFVSRLQETDVTAPVRRGEWLYYRRTLQGKQYPVHCRRPLPAEDADLAALVERLRPLAPGEDAAEQVLLDENELAEGHDYFQLGVSEPSPDGRHLAWSYDDTGAELYSLRLMDMTTGESLPDAIEQTSDTLAWAADGQTLFYTTMDHTRRPDRVWRHRLGAEAGQDTCVLHEPDGAFFCRVGRTRSGRYLLVEIESHTTREVRFLEADRPDGEFRPFRPRQRGVEYWLDHRDGHFWQLTNQGAKNFRLLRTPVPEPGGEGPGPEADEEVISGREDVKLDDFALFADHLAVLEREGGLLHVRVRDLRAEGEATADPAAQGADEADTGEDHRLAFPEPGYRLRLGENHTFHTARLRLRYDSPVTPNTDYDYDMGERELRMVGRVPVPGVDFTEYETERIHATADDGTRVPITLLYRKGMAKDGDNPCLITGYGAYGFPFDPRFDAPVLSLVDRGFVYAIAHVRGGGELGEPWHEAGKMLNKKNTFTDFIACAEHLIDEGYTRSERLALRGRSAGGLLVGAVLNLRPDLFRAALVGVPFVDVYNTMQDPSIPLTVIEYEEWGNPAEPEYGEYIRSYSPYENVGPREYPHILVTAGLHDARVQYWEPARWVARLREIKKNGNHLLLKTEMGAGHGGPSGRYHALKERAFEYAFVLVSLGVVTPEGPDADPDAPGPAPTPDEPRRAGAA